MTRHILECHGAKPYLNRHTVTDMPYLNGMLSYRNWHAIPECHGAKPHNNRHTVTDIPYLNNILSLEIGIAENVNGTLAIPE